LIDDDDDLSRDYHANTVFYMAHIMAPKGNTLLERWVVDPGSNVYICNSTNFDWLKTSEAKPIDIVSLAPLLTQYAMNAVLM
jgi:hypothetical protein